ncbi:MAG: gamma-glutamylcyclotransferase [Rhodospirillales bacterium]|nr:gamma-glutamylcyclotransferase [Rhodospirillales bacterium]
MTLGHSLAEFVAAGRAGALDAAAGELWVFAYGSLMWEPNFPCAEVRPALLRGYHRALCILSIRNRGTQARPGWCSALPAAAPAPGWR